MIDVQYFETAIAASGTKDGCRQICWFINGTHPTASPQNAIPWECLECFDGTTRDVPGGGSLANLPAGHLWKTDAVTTLPQNADLPQPWWCLAEQDNPVRQGRHVQFVLLLHGSAG